MTKPMYPDDGGLKEPVREFGEGFNVFDMIREHFGVQRIEPDPLSRGAEFRITRFGRLYYRAENTRMVAGHTRLFSSGPGTGWSVYLYSDQAPGGEWALHRRWNFGLFCIHHVEPGKKATDPAGWHITFAKLKVSKLHRGLSITWHLADTFKTKGGINLFDFYSRQAKRDD